MRITELDGLDDDALATRFRAASPANEPRLRVNFVTSLDGAVSVDGRSAGLSGPADQRVFRVLRMVCDALIVGAGTLRHEGYGALRLDERRRTWREARGYPAYPTLVVVSGDLDLAPVHPALAGAPVRPIVLTHQASRADRRSALAEVADIMVYGEEAVDLTAGVAALRERGLRQLLCEGGPHLLGALTAADLVDELCLTLSPLLAGPGAGRITAGPQPVDNAVRRLGLRDLLKAGDVLLLRYGRTG
ncbi:MAG TPA: pyrimidine reductase family protein [Micromonosporaceae bacterium]|jgi:riboflavin biosynthesis pyrimidine reductase|nr:pyrimidine reductase family protein [Micromonosporaceae bacterium]